jgi:hypothetical protein
MSHYSDIHERTTVAEPIVMEQAHTAEHGETPRAEFARLAEVLAEPQDYEALSRVFEAGETWLCDASGYSKNERTEVLAGRTAHSDGLARVATNNFLSILRDERISGQAGAWNFLVTSLTMIETNAQNPWARNFNQLFSVSGDNGTTRGVEATVQTLMKHDHKNTIALHVLGTLAADRERSIAIGRFLAGRSVTLENSHRMKYGEVIEQAKADDAHTFLQLASESGLAAEHINRTLRQLQLVKVAAFDHLIYGGTTADSNSRANCVSGTLRVGIKYGGSPSNPYLFPADQVIHDARHEGFHAGSVQTETRDGQRAGLEIKNGGGREVSEALAEYQNQVGSDFPDFQNHGNGRISYTGTYQKPVLALHLLRVRDPMTFYTLFNANYGQAQPRPLEHALRTYYRTLSGR